MKLTRVERLILCNQFRILAKLVPDEADTYDGWYEALADGYEMHYEDCCQNIYEETMSVEDSREVIDTLTMFRVLKYAVRDMKVKPEVDDWRLKFAGYDGNYETQHMAYAEYFCKHDGGRFEDLEITDFNSHSACVDGYGRMVTEWNKSKDINNPTKEEVERIAAAFSGPVSLE